MTCEMVMEQERKALVAEMMAAPLNMLPFAAANDLHEATRVPTQLRALAPAHVVPLAPGVDRAWVQVCPKFSYKSLWVTTANDYYREDYLTFLKTHHNLAVSVIPETLHVDHLFNRDRARTYGLFYIRTALVPRGINTSHGAGYEKAVGASEAQRVSRDLRKMDEVTFMKFLGFRSPRQGKGLSAEQERYCTLAAQMAAIPVEDIRRNIEELMAKAFSGWAA